jgi:hypothetical protein
MKRQIYFLLNKLNNIDKKTYIILFLVAFTVVLSSTFNPLNLRRMHIDSSAYITIAQGIIRGQLPYIDFADNKGPLTYLINVPGLFLAGFTGIWITELIFMFVTVLFAYKTALFFGDKYKALFGTIFSFIALLSFLFLYAGTEEYSLPFLMISMYIFTKYYFSPNKEVNFIELIILGICFCCAVMLKMNFFPLWAGFCFVIFVESVIKHRFAMLAKYVSGFCLGILFILAPIYFYLNSNGIFHDFFIHAILGGASRGFGDFSISGFVKNFFSVTNRTYSFLPLCMGLFWAITEFRKKEFPYYLGYSFSYFLLLLFLSFVFGDYHFNLALIPFFIPVFTFFTDLVQKEFSKRNIKKVFLVLFFCFVLIEGIARFALNFSRLLFDNSGTRLINTGRIIDENTNPGDKIISLGFNSYIYPFTKREAASKYIYQGSGLDLVPGANEEFITDILTGKPAIIAIFTAEDGHDQIMDRWHTPILELIENEYRLLSDENGYKLFIRL